MDANFKAALAVIATSAFWLFVLAIATGQPKEDTNLASYRLGYAEGKGGLPERWQYADLSMFWAKEKK